MKEAFCFALFYTVFSLVCFAGSPRMDKSTEADSIFFAVTNMALSGGATLDKDINPDVSVPVPFVKFPAVKYPETMPGVSVRFEVPAAGYYTVSAFGKPEKTMWKGYDFVEFHCHFGSDSYRMKTQLYGENHDKAGSEGMGKDGKTPYPDNDPGAYQELCRFYFIAHQPGPVEVRLQMKYATGWVKVHRLEIRHIDRHLSNEIVKKRTALYTDERIQRMKEAGIQVQQVLPISPEQLAESDEKTWKSIPDWRSMRSVWHPFDCPIHGREIRKASSIYPWQIETLPGEKHPKLVCKIGGEKYPSNNYFEGDLTSGEYPDDGMGWFDLDQKTPAAKKFVPDKQPFGKAYVPNYFWVGILTSSKLSGVGREIKSYAAAYRNTGDERYAYKGGILLAKMAYMYPCFDWAWQGSNEGLMPYRSDAGFHSQPGRCDWWARDHGNFIPLIEGYDLLYDYLRSSKELAALVGSKVPWVKSPEDLIRMMDRHFIQLGAEEVEVSMKQYGTESWFTLGTIAERPDWFRRGLELFLIQHNQMPLIWSPANVMSRDGHNQQSLFGYDLRASLGQLGEVAGWIEQSGDRQLQTDYDFWRGEPFAKVRATLEKHPTYFVAGDGQINAGDAVTTPLGVRHRVRRDMVNAQKMYALAYQHLRKPKYAYWAGGDRSLIPFASKEVQENMSKDAKTYQLPIERTRHWAGYGAVALEANVDGNLMQRAGVVCAYGPNIGEHQHKDGGCHYEVFAKGIVMSPGFGWPPGTSSPDRKNVVQIDDWIQYNGAGRCLGFVEGNGVHFADLFGVAMKSKKEMSSMIRRNLVLAEVGGGDCYLVDLVQTRGGKEKHSYHFHGTQGDVKVNVQTTPVAGDESSRAVGKTPGEVVATWDVDEAAWAKQEPNVEIKAMLGKDKLFYRVRVLGEGVDREVATFKVTRPDFPNSNLASVIDRVAPEKGKEKESTFIGIAEPYANEPMIQSVEDLAPKAKGIQLPRGVKVTCKIPGGDQAQVDVHLFSDASREAKGGGIVLKGAYGFYREVDGKPKSGLLMGNTSFLEAKGPGVARLETPAVTMELKPDFFQGTVTAVNWKTGEITVRGEIPAKASGKMVTLMTPGGRVTGYNVVSAQYDAKSGTSRVVLENLYPVGVCDVKTIDSQAGLIQTGQQPRFGNLIDWMDWGYWPPFLNGIWVVDEARKEQALLASYGPVPGREGPWFSLKQKSDVAKLTDAPGRNYGPLGEKEHLIFLYDVGVGDDIYFVPSVSVKRKADGSYDVVSTGHETVKPRKHPMR